MILFDDSSTEIRYLCKQDKHLAKLISMVGPLSYELEKEPYAFLIHEIIEQMLSKKVAARIFARFRELCQGNICIDTIDHLSNGQIHSIGISKSKVQYIRNLTKAVGARDLNDLGSLTNDRIIEELTSIHGIGIWTAKMYLLFVLGRKDILPYEDSAFLQAYQWLYNTNDTKKKSVKKRCQKWSPYSSIAARYMYIALDGGFTKRKFHLYK